MVPRRTLEGTARWRPRRIACLILLGFGALSCGPGGKQSSRAERVPVVNEPGWAVADLSLSPNGRWVAVSASSTTNRPGFRLFVLDLQSGSLQEAKPTPDATARILTEPTPGMRGMVWSENRLTFPAPRLEPTHLWPNFETGEMERQRGIAIGSRSWYVVTIEGGKVGALELDDSDEAAMRDVSIPEDVDPRLNARVRSKSSLDLLDEEAGGRKITSFRALGMNLHLSTASLSPAGDWVGLTLNREVGFMLGAKAFLVERATGRRYVLGESILGPLRFHPTRREIYGVSWERAPQHDLVRWRY